MTNHNKPKQINGQEDRTGESSKSVRASIQAFDFLRYTEKSAGLVCVICNLRDVPSLNETVVILKLTPWSEDVQLPNYHSDLRYFKNNFIEFFFVFMVSPIRDQ